MMLSQTRLLLIVISAGLTLIMASTIVTPAFAIKRFFNCMTDIANKHGMLGITDVNNCYDKEYHSGPYATHHSSGATSTHAGR